LEVIVLRLKPSSTNPSQSLKRKSPLKIDRAKRLWKALSLRYPDAHCALNWSQPHELLIATILSAQSTDVGVNKATPALFKAFPSIEAFAKSEPSDIEPFVKTLNFWRNKAKAVVESMKMIQEVYGGKVPSTMSDLLKLRGVARKTANVVLGNAFGMNEGVVVDTAAIHTFTRIRSRESRTRFDGALSSQELVPIISPADCTWKSCLQSTRKFLR